MVSNVICISITTIPVKTMESKFVNILSVRYERHVSVEYISGNARWYLYRILCFVWYSIVWLCIIFTMIFETLSRGEIGKKMFGFLKCLEHFLHEDFFKVNFYLLESEIVS